MKVFARQGVLLTLCVVFVMSMTGCPTTAVLNVQPRALTLSDTKSEVQVVISNEGSGTLRWSAQTSVPWLLLATEESEERSQNVSGSTKDSTIITVSLNKDLLPDQTDQLTAVISIESNGGTQDVEVAIQRVKVPVLALEPTSLDFGDSETEKLVEVLNEGDGVLDWTISIPAEAGWLSASPGSGSVLRSGAEAVTLKINRSLLAPSSNPYTATVTVSSNGGEEAVEVSVFASAFVASPLTIDFGLLSQPETQLVTLTTLSDDTVPLAISGGEDWLTLSSSAANISRSSSYDLRVTANPVGLDAGEYSASIQVVNEATNRTSTISISMSVGLPVSFRIEPDTLDFGESREAVQLQTTIINESASALDWSIEKPSTAGWVQLSEEEGVVENEVTITLTANPEALTPGTYNANLSVFAGGLNRILKVSLVRPADPIPDQLQVEPQTL